MNDSVIHIKQSNRSFRTVFILNHFDSVNKEGMDNVYVRMTL